MTIYCDRLTLSTCVRAIQLRRSSLSRGETCKIQVLDPLPSHGWPAVLRTMMSPLGFNVEEAQFFAGHLRNPDGQVVYGTARRASCEIAFRAAEHIVESSQLLARLNREWGRNTVLLHLARSLELPTLQLSLRLMVADTLAREAGESKAFVVVERLVACDPDIVCGLCPGMKVHFYRSRWWLLKKGRFSALCWWLRERLRELKWRVEILVGKQSGWQDTLIASKANPPSLLVMQEDDLSLDRSYRTQPHWFMADDGRPPFRTLILESGSVDRLPLDAEALAVQNIVLVSPKECGVPWGSRPPRHVDRRLRKEFWGCALQSVVGQPAEVEAVSTIARLLYRARSLAALCERANVKAFMTCENYMIWADAMQLIAPSLDIVTLSYQYSNLNYTGALMMTTADVMLTFSSQYHDRWTRDGIQPGSFVNIGYTFDTSFQLVCDRARARRSKLEEAGAKFTICYFDESVQHDKYGLISGEDHRAEILALAQLVLDDPSIGLVVKTQFMYNSPQRLDDLSDALALARATGRYMELSHGVHRNIIFPAEAALSADIAIGHAVGATAALEAALAGGRCILLNPYGWVVADTRHAQADIVYPSMTAALEAIHKYRKGDPDVARLGDWSAIVGQFDPFRDGRAGHRLRKLLEETVLRDVT